MSTIRTPANNLRVFRGSTPTIRFTLTKADGSEDDVSTVSFAFVARANMTDTSFVLQKTSSDFDMTNAATGIIKVTLSDTEIASSLANGYAELYGTTGGGTVKKVFKQLLFFIDDSVFNQ